MGSLTALERQAQHEGIEGEGRMDVQITKEDLFRARDEHFAGRGRDARLPTRDDLRGTRLIGDDAGGLVLTERAAGNELEPDA